VLTELDQTPSWEAVIVAEPALGREVAGEELELALEAIGEFAELKSPSIMGHVHAVRDLATEAATSLGLPDADLAILRRAACVYDLGRLGVPNTIWDKPGPLTRSELERVRTHPYLSERMFAFAPSLEGLGRIAVEHHERLDGSGYPRGVSGDQISATVRLLAAADVYQALCGTRPASCAERSPPGDSTETPWTASCGPRDTGSAAAASGPPALRRGRSRSSGCWRGGCRTSRSPRSW